MDENLLRYGGWSAYYYGVTSAIGLVLLFTFFAIGGPFGFLNDITGIFTFLLFPILVFVLHKMSAYAKNLSIVSASIGLVGAGGVVLLQILLVTEIMSFDQQLPLVLLAGGAIGLWQVISNRLAYSSLGKIASIGMLGGALIVAGSTIFWIGFLLGGGSLSLVDPNAFFANPLIGLGFTLVLTAYLFSPVWGVLLGKRLLSGNPNA